MSWETRPWTLRPSDHVLRDLTGRMPGYRVRLMLDPRSYDTDDMNDLRVEGTVMACTQDGPTLVLEERDLIDGGRYALIDILAVERV